MRRGGGGRGSGGLTWGRTLGVKELERAALIRVEVTLDRCLVAKTLRGAEGEAGILRAVGRAGLEGGGVSGNQSSRWLVQIVSASTTGRARARMVA